MRKKTNKIKNQCIEKSYPSSSDDEDDESYSYEGQNYDRMMHARISKFGGWLAPVAVELAYSDWLAHLRISHARQIDIFNKTTQKNMLFFFYTMKCFMHEECKLCTPVRQADHRFQNTAWNHWPFNLYSQTFLLCEQFWNEMTTNIPGVAKHHLNLVNFTTRQLLDMIAPSNFPWTNPEVFEKSINESGMNFLNGFSNWVEDTIRNINKEPPVGAEEFQVGENVAVTPGKVIYRNRLIELIQYQATTTEVYSEPILIIPAWIMKYYILDLSPHNSMVKYLVEKGHTVFMISWKNPTQEDRDLSLEDYINLGIMDALKAINHITPNQQVHTVGYCIGGTLLMLAAAAMGRERDNRLKTITLFASEIDFRDAGELKIFIDESQITYLQDIMWEKGYLDGSQMAGAFSMLRSIDLIWSRVVRDYLLGERRPINDLMAWDADTTRMPYKMHIEYLRRLFLNNDFVEGHFNVWGKRISPLDINIPIFSVSTVKDHVAPWKSVYKLHFFTDSDITFVLTNGGHNSGIVNEPGHPGRSYQMLSHKKEENSISPDEWKAKAPQYDGSWWQSWQKWLANNSGEKVIASQIGASKAYPILDDAPGSYVFQK